MKKNILKSLMVTCTVLSVIGCGGGSSSPIESEGGVSTDVPTTDTSTEEGVSTDVPTTDTSTEEGVSTDVPTTDTSTEEGVSTDVSTTDTSTEEGVSTDVPTTDTLGTDTITSDIPADIDGPVSKISQELTNTLAYMGNEERLAYDVYNALYVKYGKKTFTNIATNGEYQHITLVQELIQKYKLSDDVDFTNIEVPLGYMNTAIEDMEPGKYDVSVIQDMYDALMAMATNETEALKVGCRIEVIDIMDLDHDIVLAEAENATDIIEVFKILRAGSYNHYWAFDGALEEGCCPTALEILGGTVCPDYPQK